MNYTTKWKNLKHNFWPKEITKKWHRNGSETYRPRTMTIPVTGYLRPTALIFRVRARQTLVFSTPTGFIKLSKKHVNPKLSVCFIIALNWSYRQPKTQNSLCIVIYHVFWLVCRFVNTCKYMFCGFTLKMLESSFLALNGYIFHVTVSISIILGI